MGMIIKRGSERRLEASIIKRARIKAARTADTSDYVLVCHKFVEAVMAVRKAMKEAGSERDYDYFFGGFEQCDELLQDPVYRTSSEAQYAYQLLLGADQWLKHEAEKLGEAYVSPEHFYKCWEIVTGIDLRPKKQ